MTAAVDDSHNALPPGTRFGELEILATLGIGGFGIVYLARDHSLERDVAIKEYMPSQFAQRDGRSQVSVRSASMHETFELGRRSFVNEARLLARFDHPSLLKVYRFWEANGTAYMAMPRLVGQTLREARLTQATPPAQAWARRVFDAVLGGLEALHAQQVWHRDVAPDNIFLPADGSAPILLDFGAARHAIGDRTHAFTAILKPSFAPIEQYAEATSLKQGPWTDFYALAAVMHELLTGRPPPPCTARAMDDELEPLEVQGYSSSFLAALDWGLRVPPHQRPPTAAAWREVIEGRAEVPRPRASPAAQRAAPPPPPPKVPVAAVDIAFADTVQVMPDEMHHPSFAPAAASGPRRRKSLLLAAAGLLAVVLLVIFVVQLRDAVARRARPAVAAPAASASVAAEPAPLASAPASASAVAEAASALAPDVLTAQPVAGVMPPTGPVTRVAPAVVPASSRREGGTLKPILTEKAGDFRPVPPSPVFAPPEPAAVATVAPSQAAPTPSAAAAEPRTVAEACAGRGLLARPWCIDRQCDKPQFRNDAECVTLRERRESQGGLP
jgi:serine/threonine protein kinase